MLKLHRLELSGFKSFVDPTGLDFAGGVTAIVGPNGCGKSNLSDAVTWVMGEQSAKTLRGETMEDVIFNGSESRKPLGMAEVSLTLLTDPLFAGAEEGRVVLSRRVFRSGESQYRLNGRVVRLKDFKDLLMDTGLGIRAYSVIEQGKIGLILSGKPAERRKLLEEAAGITRYKARKRVAEVKLEEATANLLRLNDVVAEVERNLRSLKRQAGNARRLEEKQAEHRAALHAALLGRWGDLEARRRELESRLARLVEEDAAAAAELHGGEADLADDRETLEARRQALAERHRVQGDLAAVIEGRQGELKGARQTLAEIAARVAAGAALAARRAAEADEHAAALTAVAARRAELSADHERAASAVAEDERQIAAAETAAERAEAALEGARAQLAAALGEVADLRNRLHREQIESEKGGTQRAQLGEQLGLWNAQIDETAQLLADARARAAELSASVAEGERELERLSAAIEGRLELLGDLAGRRRALESRVGATRQRRELLTELSQAHRERRAGLRAALADAAIGEPRFLGDQLAARAGWERSLDLYLGELADAVILPPGRDPLELAAHLARGGASGVVVRALAGAPPPAPPADRTVLAPLAEALGLEPDLAAALPAAFLVETSADALRLAQAHPGVAFLSRDRIWAQGGALHLQGEAAQPGLLARDRESLELAERQPRLEAELAAVAAQLVGEEAEQARLADEIAAVRAAVATRREAAAVAQARLEDVEKRHRRLAVEHTTLTTEREEVERELERVAERAWSLAGDLAAGETRHRGLEAGFAAAQSAVDEARARREALRTAGAGRRGRLELLAERLTAQDQEIGRLERQASEARSQLAAWGDEASTLERRRGELESAMARAEAELQDALERRAGMAGEVVGEEEQLEARRQDLRQREERIQARRAGREELRGRLEEARVAQAGLRQGAEHLQAQFQESFGEPPPSDSTGSTASTEGGPSPARLLELEADLVRAKEALERLGPVNVLAAEEHREQEERHEFLTRQRADVAASVDSLRQTIREINQTSGERFQQTFEEVNRSFARTFTELFRGGEAEMRLLDAEDLLESGIEIVARPPGKRLTNIMLLSGGEKALTAIALLFALFRTKPSPFCILDEVDAPLDDVNTLRFVDLLRGMAGETQFIVITHNKLTMEVASTLYGVTMEERGVSKLVSVALAEVQPESRATA